MEACQLGQQPNPTPRGNPPRYLSTASEERSSGLGGISMGTSGSSGSMGSAGGSGCPSSVQALGSQRNQGGGQVVTDSDKGWATRLWAWCHRDAYHRSSGGMRLVRDFSSSAASRESSVEGESTEEASPLGSEELGGLVARLGMQFSGEAFARHDKAQCSVSDTTKLPSWSLFTLVQSGSAGESNLCFRVLHAPSPSAMASAAGVLAA